VLLFTKHCPHEAQILDIEVAGVPHFLVLLALIRAENLRDMNPEAAPFLGGTFGGVGGVASCWEETHGSRLPLFPSAI